jgi:hypothetical protein
MRPQRSQFDTVLSVSSSRVCIEHLVQARLLGFAISMTAVTVAFAT